MPEEKDFYNKVKSAITIGKWNWNESYRVSMPNQRVLAPRENLKAEFVTG